MQRYIIGRLLLLLPTLIGVSLIVFVTMRMLPGDVVEVSLGSAQNVTPEQKLQLLRRLLEYREHLCCQPSQTLPSCPSMYRNYSGCHRI